jgi:TonB family protein
VDVHVNGRRFFLIEHKKVSAKVLLDVIGDGQEIPYWCGNVRHEYRDLYHIPVQVLISRAGEKEAVVIQVRIQKDGSLADKFVTIVSSSGEKDFDAAALSAIRTAAPFARLPEGYSGTYLDLQISFYYNTTPPEPDQKPKVVPTVATANQTI